MPTFIRWAGKVMEREIYGLIFKPGQVHKVDDPDVALDILTQPEEPFEEVKPGDPDYPADAENHEPQLIDILGIGAARARDLQRLGVKTLDDLVELDDEGIDALAGALKGIAGEQVLDWVEQARKLLATGPQDTNIIL